MRIIEVPTTKVREEMRASSISKTLRVAVVLAIGAAPANALADAEAVNLDRGVKVFIVAGQSNAKGYNNIAEFGGGRGEFPSALRHQPGILFWPSADPSEKQREEWGELRTARAGSFGPEISFAHDLAASMPNHEIAIIKCAVGGTGIARSKNYTDYIPALKGFDDEGKNWHPLAEGREAGLLYQWLLSSVRDALAVLDKRDVQWELAGFLWMQGEHEAGISRKMAEDYGKLLNGFVSAVRSDLKSPSLPFLIGEINSHTWAFGDIARKNQIQVCQGDRNSVLVKTADLSRAGSGGASHFDADGMLKLGSRFAEAFLSLSDGSTRSRRRSRP